MQIEPLAIEGAYRITPTVHPDQRGAFWESCRPDLLTEHLGYTPTFVQTNVSVSAAGVVRGVHFSRFPGSQSKYVTAVRGRFTDLIVDIRAGSPTWGEHVAVELDAATPSAVFLSEGLGHAVIAHTDDSALLYQVSTTFNPAQEGAVTAWDDQLGLHTYLPENPVVSDKDRAAPTLADALTAGQVPTFEEWRAWDQARRGMNVVSP